MKTEYVPAPNPVWLLTPFPEMGLPGVGKFPPDQEKKKSVGLPWISKTMLPFRLPLQVGFWVLGGKKTTDWPKARLPNSPIIPNKNSKGKRCIIR
jgi:hypothetical protein